MMRFQRNDHKGSRPKMVDGVTIAHPRPSEHTFESYRSRTSHPRLTRLRRLRRLATKERIRRQEEAGQ